MEDYFSRLWNDLAARVSGPLSLRFYLQPAMATFFAIRSGLSDAKAGRPPYFYSIFYDPSQRRSMLTDGWRAIGKVFVLAIVLDAVFQLIVFKWIYPVELVVIAFVLACVPYLLIRGPANRVARGFSRRSVQKLSIVIAGALCLSIGV